VLAKVFVSQPLVQPLRDLVRVRHLGFGRYLRQRARLVLEIGTK
jgi:hypothetical protein